MVCWAALLPSAGSWGGGQVVEAARCLPWLVLWGRVRQACAHMRWQPGVSVPAPPPRALCAAGDVCYWELVDAQLLTRFRAHAGVPTGLAVHPSGRLLVTSGVDAAVRVWVP